MNFELRIVNLYFGIFESMKLNHRLALLAYMICNAIWAQEGAGMEKSVTPKKNRILFAPFNFADISNPSIQLGYERFLNEKISAQVEFGVITRRSAWGFMIVDLFGYSDQNLNRYSGFKTRVELKRNFIKRRGLFGDSFFSAEVFFNKNDGKVSASFQVADSTFQYSIPRPPGRNVYNDSFELKRRKVGLNLKYGVRFPFNRLEIEAYAGIGIAYRIATQTGRMNPDDPLFGENWYFDTRHGNSFVISVPINVKCGWRF
jgi:hypothetical protein